MVMGVSGSGKTTLATLLGERLGWVTAEADDFHPQANIAKMASGRPLDDADRWMWLSAIRDWMSGHSAPETGTVVTCSALRRRYRDLLRQAEGVVRFIHVTGDPSTIARRVERRSGHFMPPALLPSQLQALEPLDADEDGITLPNNTTPQDLADRALAALGLQPRFPRTGPHARN
ncbi:gluconokinase [Zafaria cholistanensis]|uniref:Gluconokinase n=1 Tax=Zafaria cholistanensis TaxID=1682741 RepID=A0A5A7NSQ4_9MICC|nr:gluconokinase [Zafaria cholistanensis]